MIRNNSKTKSTFSDNKENAERYFEKIVNTPKDQHHDLFNNLFSQYYLTKPLSDYSVRELTTHIVLQVFDMSLTIKGGNSNTAEPNVLLLSEEGKVMVRICSDFQKYGQKQLGYFLFKDVLTGQLDKYKNRPLLTRSEPGDELYSDTVPPPLENMDDNDIATRCACLLLDYLGKK